MGERREGAVLVQKQVVKVALRELTGMRGGGFHQIGRLQSASSARPAPWRRSTGAGLPAPALPVQENRNHSATWRNLRGIVAK